MQNDKVARQVGAAVEPVGKATWMPRIQPRWLLFLLVLLGSTWVLPRTAGLFICGAVALYALRGPRETVQAITILAFLIISGKTGISMGRWLIIFAAFGRVVWDGVLLSGRWPRVVGILAVFGGATLVLSLWSTFPLVSVLKLVTFVLGVAALLTSAYRTRHLRQYWLSWLYTLGIFILLASVPLFFLPEGYTRNGSGFQGILTHPQTFGPVLAPITALVTGLYLFHRDRSVVVKVAVVLGWVGMYLSGARTSMLATLLALAVVGLGGLLFKASTWGSRMVDALAQPAVGVAGVVLVVMMLVQGQVLQDAIGGFIFKDDEATAVTDVLEASRGSRIAASMENFRDAPLTGIGFGVPSNTDGFVHRVETGVLGLPMGASVEKGFMPTAVLEETGLVGALLVVMVLLALVAPVARHPDPTLCWIMASCLLVNLGEMVFFSLGGMGLYFWVVMALCYAIAQNRPVNGVDVRKVQHAARA